VTAGLAVLGVGAWWGGVRLARVWDVCARQRDKHRCPNSAASHTVSSKAVTKIAPWKLQVDCYVECTVVCRDAGGRKLGKEVTSVGIGG